MTRQIVVTTGARLHFGLLANAPTSGRHFGGAGLMIDAPGVQVAVQACDDMDQIDSPENVRYRAQQFLSLYRTHCPRDQQPPPCRLEIRRAIPSHRGLGSGTQLGMAIAQALQLLSGASHSPPTALAACVGRGLRSALGIHGFGQGGFLVDGGKQSPDRVGPLIARAEFPPDWRFVLITPPEETGLSGHAERDAFSRLPPMPQSTTELLCRILVMELLPAVVEAEFETCGEALYEFGRRVGHYFAPVQGGPYANARMSRLVDHLRRDGIRGVGQTSWGPTLFALTPDAASAEQLMADLQANSRWADCQFLIAAPMNTGAAIEVL